MILPKTEKLATWSYKKLRKLIRARKTLTCLSPNCDHQFQESNGMLVLHRSSEEDRGLFLFNFTRAEQKYDLGNLKFQDVLLEEDEKSGKIKVPPYGFLWLSHLH